MRARAADDEQLLDPILHQPVRTRIVAYLATRGETTFTELKNTLAITDGNLEAHIKKLTAADYIEARRESGEGRPQTLYDLTTSGRKAFGRYVDALQALLRPKP
jgi:predicted ArsR family transcriptional regulator